MKGKGFYLLKYIRGQGNLSFQSVKGPKWLTDELYKVEKTFYFCD